MLAMAAMAAVASMATMTSPKSIAPCSSIAVGKVVAITPLCRSTRVGFGVANLSGRRWTPLVVVQAQVEKSSVQERSWEEKDRDLVASQGFFQDQSVEYEGIEEAEEEEEEKEEDYGVDVGANAAFNAAGGEEDYGEVNKILASRVVDGETQYLIEWKDDHPDSWEPPANIAKYGRISFFGMAVEWCLKGPLRHILNCIVHSKVFTLIAIGVLSLRTMFFHHFPSSEYFVASIFAFSNIFSSCWSLTGIEFMDPYPQILLMQQEK